MPRLVHLTGESRRRGIARAGIRGGAGYLGLACAVFASPVVPDFALTHQWLRELKRRHGERMIAVHFRAPSDEVVLVGRYGKPHASVPLREAIRRVLAEPAGAEIVLTRSIPKKDVLAVREVTQLVGWTEVPSGEPKWDCLCPRCVPPGTPDLVRRARAAFDRQMLAARKATSDGERARAIAQADVALERARGRIAPTKLAAFARSPSAEVRVAVAQQLWSFRWAEVEALLDALVHDPDADVRKHAATSMLRAAGVRRAWPRLIGGDDDVLVPLAERLFFGGGDLGVALGYLEKLAAIAPPTVLRAMRADARTWLEDEELAPAVRARLERLRDPAIEARS